MVKERLIPEPCDSCGARCCRAGQEFGFGGDIEGARRFITLNEGVLLRRDPNRGIVLRLVEDCRGLDGNACTLHDQPDYFGPCRSLEADGDWCKSIGCATCTNTGSAVTAGKDLGDVNGRSKNEMTGMGHMSVDQVGQPDTEGVKSGFPDVGMRMVPVEEIPVEFRRQVPLPGGGTQIIDTRHAYYRWVPDVNGSGGCYVECS